MTKSRIVIIAGFILIAAYLIWNYRYEYTKTYTYKEVSLTEAGAWVPAEQQPKAEGIVLYTLAKRDQEEHPYRYVLWSKQSDKEQGYQIAQLKRATEGFTINVKPVTATQSDQIKADLVIEIESKTDLKPFLIYMENKKISVKEVTVP